MADGSYKIQLDSVQIGAADINEVSRSYALLLGTSPQHSSKGGIRFQLSIGAVELVEGCAGIRSIRFTTGSSVQTGLRESFSGLDVLFSPASAAGVPSSADSNQVEAIDHIVLQTANVDRALTLWRDKLGLRLALDREFPERGLRLVFFRSGGMTLEIASTLQRVGGDDCDTYYGVTYRVGDIAACRDRLVANGVDVSAVRTGHKPGTMVATVRSSTAGVPTLLLQDPSRRAL